MTDDQKAALITIGLAAFESLWAEEREINPNSRRAREIEKLLDLTVKTTDLYRHNEWPPEKVSRACRVLDTANEILGAEFGRGVHVTPAEWFQSVHMGE